MTEESAGRSASVWPIWAWIMVLVGFAVTGVGILGGVFSRSLVLDLISFWPGLILVMLVAAALYPFHRGEWSRLAAVVPLLLLTWLGSTITLYLSEWSILPSASADFTGPDIAAESNGRISVSNQGDLNVTASSEPAMYSIETIRRGGATSAPISLERSDSDGFQVLISERTEPNWFVSKGWRLKLATSVAWDLELEAGNLDADLGDLAVTALRLAGAGRVVLPEGSGSTPVVVDGDYELIVPEGTAMLISGGNVQVPSNWIETDGSWRSPVDGDGYLVTVTGEAAVVVRNA